MTVCYSVPDEFTSPRFCKAFAQGCGGEVTTGAELMPGDVAMFGSPQRWALLKQAQAEGRQWDYGDHAYFGRRRFFRITRNAYQHDASGEGDARRFEALGIRLKKWRGDGRCIVVCPNSEAFFELHGLNAHEWVKVTTEKIRMHTDRPIVLRWKHQQGRPLEYDLRDAWACVVYVSVCGVHAALEGVASFATAPCASASFGSMDLSRIESPTRPDNRLEMAAALASNQWTFAEMSSGMAWKELQA